MVSTVELELLRAVERAGGEAHFQVVKRMVLPYRPRLIEELCWSLDKAGLLDLSPYSGMIKLTPRGRQALGQSYFWKGGKRR